MILSSHHEKEKEEKIRRKSIADQIEIQIGGKKKIFQEECTVRNEEEFASRERERGKAFAKDSWKHAELLPCWSPSAIYNENIFTMPNHCYYVSIDIYLGSHLASTSIDLSTPFSPLPLPLLGQRINARRNCHVRKNNFRNHYQFRGGQSLLSILSFIEFRSDSSDLLSIRQEEFTTEVFHSRYFPAY